MLPGRRARIAACLAIFSVGAITAAARWNTALNVFAQFVEAERPRLETTDDDVKNTKTEPLTIGTCDTGGPIEVESTAGIAGPTAYPTLKDAFDIINAGGHQGSVNIEVCGSTSESTSAVLNNSGAGGALYTDITIRPVGGSHTIQGSVSGAVIKLNGADNVTIDGRIGGSGRNLTVRNNASGSATAAIWLASVTPGNGARNNVIRNLEIAAGQTATGGTNTTIGIYMGGSTISLAAADGNDNDNNQFIFNRVVRARYGIVTRGATSNNNQAPIITDNIIGPSAFGADEIGKTGIYMQADTGAVVSRNVVQFIGGPVVNSTSGADRCGICIGGENWSVTDNTTVTSSDYTVTKNIIHDIIEERGFSAIGIRLGTTRSGSPTNNVVANNFIYNIRANGTNGHQVVGIGYANGNADEIVFNSISITGSQDAGATTLSSTYGNGIRVSQENAANNANLVLMDNSIYIDASSGTPANHYYAITLNSNTYSFGTGGLNFNNYYVNARNPQVFTGGLAASETLNTAATEFVTLANWQEALAAPQDKNSVQADPLYHSPVSDLHLSNGSPNTDAAASIPGVLDDIDGDPRVGSLDIGADETVSADSTLIQFSSPTYSVSENAGTAVVTVTRTGGLTGTATVNYATSNGTATGGGSCTLGIDYIATSGTLTFLNGETSKTFNTTVCNDAVVEPTETINYTLSSPTGGATIGSPGTAVLSIANDGGVLGTLSIDDFRVLEGNAGTATATFAVTYAGGTGPVSVHYSTANGSAIAGLDYTSTDGVLNFGSLVEQTQNVSVTVIGDTKKEANETFFLDLANPVNATIARGQGIGTIIDDDRAGVSDFDGDRIADFSIFRPSEGRFYTLKSTTVAASINNFGFSGDIPVPGDYDGDGKTDIAVWRPSTGTWFVIQSSNGSALIANWGSPGDRAVQGDFDGDGKTDMAVFRPSTGTWWILRSSDLAAFVVTFGIGTDRPVQCDYDGDGRSDPALYRDGTWFILQSSDSQPLIQNWGLSSDIPVTGDFDGDGKDDLTVFRDGDWWIYRSLTGTAFATHFGSAGDIPVAADYDRDGTTDIGVFRPPTGDWYVLRSADNTSLAFHWGQEGDIPIPKAYLPQ